MRDTSALRLTQYKRFVPYITHPKPGLIGASYVLETLYEILAAEKR